MISVLRNIAIVLWLAFAFLLGTLLSILRWKNPNNMHDAMKLFAWGSLPLAGVQVELEGAEHLEKHQPCVYISNHQSNMDVATFGKWYPHRTVGIGKKEIIYLPFFGIFFAAAGNILIDRQNKKSAAGSMSQAAEIIRKQGLSVGIFPEGTRNKTGKGMLPFKKGAFHLAAEAGVPLVPYVSSPIAAIYDRETKKLKGGQVILRILPPIRVKSSSKEDISEAFTESRKQMLAAYYELAEKVGISEIRET